MSTAKRNLWILVSLSAVFLVAQDWFQSRSFTSEKQSCITQTTCVSSTMYSKKYKSCRMTTLISEPGINDFIAVDHTPEPLNMEIVSALIGYPESVRQEGIEGMVTVRVLVDENGQYVKHEVLRSVHPVLIQEVESHLSDLTFSPASQNGQPVQFWTNVPFSFQLK